MRCSISRTAKRYSSSLRLSARAERGGDTLRIVADQIQNALAVRQAAGASGGIDSEILRAEEALEDTMRGSISGGIGEAGPRQEMLLV